MIRSLFIIVNDRIMKNNDRIVNNDLIMQNSDRIHVFRDPIAIIHEKNDGITNFDHFRRLDHEKT